jgi:hypothetical protein
VHSISVVTLRNGPGLVWRPCGRFPYWSHALNSRGDCAGTWASQSPDVRSMRARRTVARRPIVAEDGPLYPDTPRLMGEHSKVGGSISDAAGITRRTDRGWRKYTPLPPKRTPRLLSALLIVLILLTLHLKPGMLGLPRVCMKAINCWMSDRSALMVARLLFRPSRARRKYGSDNHRKIILNRTKNCRGRRERGNSGSDNHRYRNLITKVLGDTMGFLSTLLIASVSTLVLLTSRR